MPLPTATRIGAERNSPLSILILEDEVAHDQAIRRAFSTAGTLTEIRTASSLREYCELATSRQPDVAIVDLNLPDSHGMETLSFLSEHPHFPVIVMTSFGNEAVAVSVMKAGALDYLVKSPEAFAEIPHTVQHVMREWGLIEDRRRAEEALRVSLVEKDTLLKEIHHRVKNNMQMVLSLLRMQSRRNINPGVNAALEDIQNRVLCMALVHEHLYRSDTLTLVDFSACLKSLCLQLFRAMAPSATNIELHLDLARVDLKAVHAVPCGLLVNELVSNALNHAFPEGRAGEIRVELHPDADGPGWHLRVSDNGVGLPADFDLNRLRSLGLKLVTDLTKQIGGRLKIGEGPGAVFELEIREESGG